LPGGRDTHGLSGKVGVCLRPGCPVAPLDGSAALGQPYAIVRGCRSKSEHTMWQFCLELIIQHAGLRRMLTGS
jgi:hypothetical protein